MSEMSEELVVQEVFDLHQVAQRVRRDPRLARELSVLTLAQGVSARWRQTEDMLQASEDVPVAAWIVRKKVEGLIRPDEPEVDQEGYDSSERPEWLSWGVDQLQILMDSASHMQARLFVSERERPPAPLKDPSLWKLACSYPRLKQKKEPAPRVVQRAEEPLQDRMQMILNRLGEVPELCLQNDLAGRPRREWVGSFLAVVHLWHQDHIAATQQEPFGHIWCQRIENPISSKGSH